MSVPTDAPVGREAPAEEQRRKRPARATSWLRSRAATARTTQAGDRHDPADVLGRVHVEVAAQLVVQKRQREERQEARARARPSHSSAHRLAASPSIGRPSGRRARAVEATTSPPWKLFKYAALRQLPACRGHPTGATAPGTLPCVGQLEAVGRVSPCPEHLEQERRASVHRRRLRRGTTRPAAMANRSSASSSAVATGGVWAARAEARRPQRAGYASRATRNDHAETVVTTEPGRGEAMAAVAQLKGQPCCVASPARRAGTSIAPTSPGLARARLAVPRVAGAHSNTTQKSPAISYICRILEERVVEE